MELGQHISQRYDQELEELRTQVLKMGGLVETQADNAVKALLERDGELVSAIENNERQINKMEMEIDEICTLLIARRQPTARDLRLVVAVIKIITDLERIGDEAEDVGKYAAKLANKPAISGMHSELTHLSSLVLGMLRDALDAFARMDVEQALKILGMNKTVNKEFNNLFRLLITFMMEDPRNLKNVLKITWCGRSLERIGDHSRNICEYVVYLVEGEDIRHTSIDKLRGLGLAGEEESN